MTSKLNDLEIEKAIEELVDGCHNYYTREKEQRTRSALESLIAQRLAERDAHIAALTRELEEAHKALKCGRFLGIGAHYCALDAGHAGECAP